MPSSFTTSSLSQNLSTLALFLLLLVALFPGFFHHLCLLPLIYLNPFGSQAPRTPELDVAAPPSVTMWFQKQFTLPPRSRGSYLVTSEVIEALPEIRQYKVGILNLFVQHTSCALSLNENWDEDVRADMSDALDRIAPEAGPKGEELYRHSAEGSDDMPAHIKSALIGASVTIPIKDGKLATGTWQGIWYLEFRAMRHTRRVMATIQGEKA
jgi:secondary thiamine-phosphate synthase enzyme